MNLDATRVPVPGNRIAARIVSGQALVLDPAATELRRMNEVGSFVWGLISERRFTVAQIHQAIVEEFDVEVGTALSDLETFLEKLHTQGVITYITD